MPFPLAKVLVECHQLMWRVFRYGGPGILIYSHVIGGCTRRQKYGDQYMFHDKPLYYSTALYLQCVSGILAAVGFEQVWLCGVMQAAEHYTLPFTIYSSSPGSAFALYDALAMIST